MISCLYGTILFSIHEINIPEQQWNNLIPNIFQIYESGSDEKRLQVLRLFQNIFVETKDMLSEYAPNFQKLFDLTINHQNLLIKLESINTLLQSIISLKPAVIKNFKIFIPQIFCQLNEVIEKKDEQWLEKLMEKVLNICQNKPSFFKK